MCRKGAHWSDAYRGREAERGLEMINCANHRVGELAEVPLLSGQSL